MNWKDFACDKVIKPRTPWFIYSFYCTFFVLQQIKIKLKHLTKQTSKVITKKLEIWIIKKKLKLFMMQWKVDAEYFTKVCFFPLKMDPRDLYYYSLMMEDEWGNTESRNQSTGSDEKVEACTYWARRGRERGPPSRNPQRSARCWTWWRLQRRRHSDQTPAWKAPRESTPGADQTFGKKKQKQKEKEAAKRLETVTNREIMSDVQPGGRDHSGHCFRQSLGTSWFKGGASRSMGQVRAEDSLARTFLYIVSIVTDPKHNAGTSFPTSQLRWLQTWPQWV